MKKVGTKVAFETVAQKLNEWYKVIKQNNIEKAIEMKEEIIRVLPDMVKNQDVLLYFNLLDSRFNLLIENYNASGEIIDDLDSDSLEASTDNMIQYYFFFFSGMYQFYKKNFTEAINFYRRAERSVALIPDEVERAEFNYQIAKAYYEIHQNWFSLNHAEKALESFLASDNYAHKAAATQMIIACNQLDLFRYTDAESLFKKSIRMATKNEEKYAQALGHYNLGICYERQEKLDLARDSFEIALDILEEQESKMSTLRATYMLTRVLLKKGLYEDADYWYQKGLDLSSELNEKTYAAKLSIIYSIYRDRNESSLDKGLEQLRKEKLWSDVADLTINAARHFKKEDCLYLASKYFDEGISARDKILTWTEEINT